VLILKQVYQPISGNFNNYGHPYAAF